MISCVLSTSAEGNTPKGVPHRVQGSVDAAEPPSTGLMPQSHLAPFALLYGALLHIISFYVMVAERAPLLTGCERITVPRPLSHFGSDGTYLWGSLSGPGRRSQCRGVLAGVHHRWSVLEPFWLGPPRVWTYHCPWLVPSGYPTSCVPSVTRTRAHRWVSNGKNPLTAPCGSTNVCSARSTPSWARGAYAGRIPSRCTWGTFCFLVAEPWLRYHRCHRSPLVCTHHTNTSARNVSTSLRLACGARWRQHTGAEVRGREPA